MLLDKGKTAISRKPKLIWTLGILASGILGLERGAYPDDNTEGEEVAVTNVGVGAPCGL